MTDTPVRLGVGRRRLFPEQPACHPSSMPVPIGGAGGNMADRCGRLGREAGAASVVHPCAEMTPCKSRRPARVASSGGSLTPPGPWSWKMTANKASCLAGHSIRRTHFSPPTLRTSLFLPGTQSSWLRGVFLPGHQILNCPPITGPSAVTPPLPSQLPKII